MSGQMVFKFPKIMPQHNLRIGQSLSIGRFRNKLQRNRASCYSDFCSAFFCKTATRYDTRNFCCCTIKVSCVVSLTHRQVCHMTHWSLQNDNKFADNKSRAGVLNFFVYFISPQSLKCQQLSSPSKCDQVQLLLYSSS